MISIDAVNRDFPKCSLLFSVKREMLMLYFFVNCERAVLFSVKRDL